MRKKILIPALMAFVFASCGGGGGFESDVKQMAKLKCEVQKLEAKDQSDESVKKALEAAEKAEKEFDEKMEKKYDKKEPSESQQKAAAKIMMEVMAACK